MKKTPFGRSKSKVEDRKMAQWLGLTLAFLTPVGFKGTTNRTPTFAQQRKGVQMEAELKKGRSILKNSKKCLQNPFKKKKKKWKMRSGLSLFRSYVSGNSAWGAGV